MAEDLSHERRHQRPRRRPHQQPHQRHWAEADVAAPSRALEVFLGLVLLTLLLAAMLLLT